MENSVILCVKSQRKLGLQGRQHNLEAEQTADLQVSQSVDAFGLL